MVEIGLFEKVDLAPSESKTVTIYKVSPGRILTTKNIVFSFPFGTNYEVEVEVFRNDTKELPKNTKVVGENEQIKFEVGIKFYADEEIRVKARNLSDTESKTVLVKVDAIEE